MKFNNQPIARKVHLHVGQDNILSDKVKDELLILKYSREKMRLCQKMIS